MSKLATFAFTAGKDRHIGLSLLFASLFLVSCGEHTFDDFWEDIFGSSSSAGEEELSSSSSAGRSSSSSSRGGGSSAECDAVNTVPITLHGVPENHPKVPLWKTAIDCMHSGWKKHLKEVYLGDQEYFDSNGKSNANGFANSSPRRITLKVTAESATLGSNYLSLLHHEIAHVIDVADYYSGENSLYTVNGRNFIQIMNSLSSDERERFRSGGNREEFAAGVGRTKREIADGTVGNGANFIPADVRAYMLKFIEDIEAGRTGTHEGARYPELEKMHGTYRADNGAAIGLASDSFAWDSGNVHWVGNVDSYAYSSNGNAATKEAYPKGFKISGTIAETNERNKSAGDDFSQTIFFHPDFNSIARAGVIYYRQ